MKLTLAHHAVASKTKVLHERGAVGMAVQMPMQRRFSVELRKKNRVASRQPHHRVAPFAILRQVHRRRTRRADNHVGDQARDCAGRVVAARALIGSEELLRTAFGLRRWNHVIKRLRDHAGRRGRWQRPEIGEDGIRHAADEHRRLRGLQRVRRRPRREIVHAVDHRRQIRERTGRTGTRRVQVRGTRIGPRIRDRRRVTIQTVQSRAVEMDLRLGASTARQRRRRRVRIPRRGTRQVGPVPSVPRQVRVFDHHGPPEHRIGRALILFLHDHRAVGHWPDAVLDGDPIEQRGRVPDPDVRMNAVAGADLRVMLPVLFLVAEMVHEGRQMNQKIGIGGRRQRRARAGMRRSCSKARNCCRCRTRQRIVIAKKITPIRRCVRKSRRLVRGIVVGPTQNAWYRVARQLPLCRVG